MAGAGFSNKGSSCKRAAQPPCLLFPALRGSLYIALQTPSQLKYSTGEGRLEEARSAAASAQSLLERGEGGEEQRREAAELLAVVSETREAWEARGRGLEAPEAGARGSEAWPGECGSRWS